MKRILPLIALAILSGCASLQPHAAHTHSLTADSGSRIAPAGALVAPFSGVFGAGASPQIPIYCVSSSQIQCSPTANPGNGTQGDPAWMSFGKADAWGQQLGLFSVNGVNQVLGTGSTGIVGLETLTAPDIAAALSTSSLINGSTVPATAGTLFGSTGTFTIGDCLEVGATNPLEAKDAGAACGTGGGSSGVSSITGDGALFTNSASTGAVTLTLGSAVAYGVWGNPTSASATPNYTALSSWPAAAFPTLNQNTTGYAASLTANGYTLPCTVPTLVSGDYLTNNGTTCNWATPTAGGTVTSLSVATANGFSGTVANPTTTPAITLNTSFTGLGYSTSGSGWAAATASEVLALVNGQSCNAQTGTTYTFVLSDANGCVSMANAAANTVTVPADASVAFSVGTTLTVVQNGAGATTVQGAGSPVTLESAKYGSSTTQTYVFPSEYSCIQLQKISTDTWFVASCDYNPGGGLGTVTDGAGTTTANELAVSTTTAHTLGYSATLPTAAMPALIGDLSGTTGSLSVTVTGVNGATVPASASTGVCTNASGQVIACTTITYLQDTGTAFTLGTGTGACATDSVVKAGAANGEVTCTGTTGASTLVVNLPTSTNGWACTANDITTPAVIPESAFTVSAVTFSGTVTANDNIVIQCTGF